ncbi:MAG: PQQ-binding-like beta-propeller repeat protein, partial [Myxococcales bacterium]|nr:PQQ-binding-like beta-propeller repeat protein [Myxococcales bacterium]
MRRHGRRGWVTPSAAAAFFASAWVAGCAPYTPLPAFDPRFADNRLEDTRAVASSAEVGSGPAESAFVGTTEVGGGVAVSLWDLPSGKARWSTRLDAVTRPILLGDLVIVGTHSKGAETERAVALDATSGRERWALDLDHDAFLGATRSGSLVAVVAGRGAGGGSARRGRVIAVDARTGSSAWERTTSGVLGAPASAGPWIFVPWERQNIAVIDVRTGRERARLRSTDDVIAWVKAEASGIYYGGATLYRLSDASATGKRETTPHVEPRVEGVPGHPLPEDDGFAPPPAKRSARGRIRYYARPADVPAAGGDIALATGHFYFAYFRYVFAFTADGALDWVRILPAAVADGRVLEGGLLVTTEDGTARLLASTTGNDAFTAPLGGAIASANLESIGAVSTAAAGERRDLRTSLNEVALDPDNTLVPGRAFAVAELAKLPDPEVTRDLLDLYAQRSMPKGVRAALETAMGTRRAGVEHAVKALERHYDFLDGTEAPPFGLIVPTLVTNRRTDALPGLVSHLFDHETPAEDLPRIAAAIRELGDAAVVPALTAFLERYHADSALAGHPDALGETARGIFTLGGPGGRTLLTDLSHDARTLPDVSARITALFTAEQAARDAEAKADAQARALAAAEAARRD